MPAPAGCCCPLPSARLVSSSLARDSHVVVPWGIISMKDGLTLPAHISSNGSCCLTCWGGPWCPSLGLFAQGRDTGGKTRRRRHYNYLIFCCLFSFYFFLSSWTFFTSRCHTKLSSPAAVLGSMFPLRQLFYFSRLSPFAVVQGQHWEQGTRAPGTEVPGIQGPLSKPSPHMSEKAAMKISIALP